MKKRMKWLALCLGTMMCCTACSSHTAKESDQTLTENTTKPNENGTHVTENDVQQQEEQNQEPQNQVSKEELKNVTVYGYDDQGTMIPKKVSVTGDLAKALISELEKEKVLPAGIEILNFTKNEEEKRLDIDVNTEFGDYIRRMGTFGETVTIECFVRTFAEAYNCTQVKITENGAVLESGHAIYDGYISYE